MGMANNVDIKENYNPYPYNINKWTTEALAVWICIYEYMHLKKKYIWAEAISDLLFSIHLTTNLDTFILD